MACFLIRVNSGRFKLSFQTLVMPGKNYTDFRQFLRERTIMVHGVFAVFDLYHLHILL